MVVLVPARSFGCVAAAGVLQGIFVSAPRAAVQKTSVAEPLEWLFGESGGWALNPRVLSSSRDLLPQAALLRCVATLPPCCFFSGGMQVVSRGSCPAS